MKKRLLAPLVAALTLMPSLAGPLLAADQAQTSVVWADGRRSVLSSTNQLLRYTTFVISPEYPYEVKRLRISGTGVYEFQIDKTGRTTGIAIVSSSGNRILDEVAVNALIKWRFKPGVFRRVRMPVTWTLTAPPRN